MVKCVFFKQRLQMAHQSFLIFIEKLFKRKKEKGKKKKKVYIYIYACYINT